MRKVLAVASAGFMLAFGAAFTAQSALAAPGDAYPGAGWELIDTKVDGTDVTRGPAADSKILSRNAVALVRKDGAVGTSVESANLDVSADAGDLIKVDYTLSGGAKVSAGAIRMFYYDKANADTMKEAPTGVAIATDGTSNTGTLTIPAKAGRVGTFGLVYDSSNDSTGTVTFRNLTVDETHVVFIAPPVKVRTQPPTLGEVACVKGKADVKVNTPTIKGVKYEVGTPADGKVKLTATALDGFVLVGDTEWTLEYKEPCESPTPSPTTSSPVPTPSQTTTDPGNGGGGPVPSQTSEPAPSVSTSNAAGELPVTGSSRGMFLGLMGGGLLLISVGGSLLWYLRRRRDADEVSFTS